MGALRRLGTAATLSAMLFAAGGLDAASPGIVKKRIAAMEAAVKSIDAALKSGSAVDRAGLARQAQIIADQGDRIVELFPAGSGVKGSGASPRIWKEADAFAARADALVDAAIDFNSTAEDGDRKALTETFAEIGRACAACHQDFRLKKAK